MDASAANSAAAAAAGLAPDGPQQLVSLPSRKRFEFQGQLVYEWEQSMSEVLIFVRPPAGVKAAHLQCNITKTHLSLGIKGNPPFIDVRFLVQYPIANLIGLTSLFPQLSTTTTTQEDFFETVVSDESMWTMDDGEVEINLQKMKKALTWDSALKGHGELDPLAKTQVQKQMTLERFQEEHPGFDFSGADFSGAPPDPRTFLDGVPYTK